MNSAGRSMQVLPGSPRHSFQSLLGILTRPATQREALCAVSRQPAAFLARRASHRRRAPPPSALTKARRATPGPARADWENAAQGLNSGAGGPAPPAGAPEVRCPTLCRAWLVCLRTLA